MKNVKQLLARVIGNENVLSNNVLFIDFAGSHEKGQYLSQLFYWSGRTKNKEGWFAKKYEDWFSEIRVKEHSIRRYTKQFVKAGFLETKFKKFNNVPTLHYRLNTDLLLEKLLDFCEGNNLSGSNDVRVEGNNLSGSRVTTCMPPLTEITTEITTDNKLQNQDFAEEEGKGITDTKQTEEESTPPTPAAPPQERFAKITGIKKKIGPKHYDLLNELAEDEEAYHLLRNLFTVGPSVEENAFYVFLDWLEYKKSKKQTYTSSKYFKTLLKKQFEGFLYEEIKDAYDTAEGAGYAGMFTQKNNTLRSQNAQAVESNLQTVLGGRTKLKAI